MRYIHTRLRPNGGDITGIQYHVSASDNVLLPDQPDCQGETSYYRQATEFVHNPQSTGTGFALPIESLVANKGGMIVSQQARNNPIQSARLQRDSRAIATKWAV